MTINLTHFHWPVISCFAHSSHSLVFFWFDTFVVVIGANPNFVETLYPLITKGSDDMISELTKSITRAKTKVAPIFIIVVYIKNVVCTRLKKCSTWLKKGGTWQQWNKTGFSIILCPTRLNMPPDVKPY